MFPPKAVTPSCRARRAIISTLAANSMQVSPQVHNQSLYGRETNLNFDEVWRDFKISFEFYSNTLAAQDW